MASIDFLAVVPLAAYQGLALGATATRALERFSDLTLGIEPLARQPRRARLDIIDECLDLVLIEAEAPAGFRFTGCFQALAQPVVERLPALSLTVAADSEVSTLSQR
ncbi:hypothetical protein U5801_25265 [Lamprobacter modestohalophilus]|uniref:hypothetical protein n=1 Tax=Lamprobacter modestohalophilus TaxID=1064514 RepID=UPI002ADEB0B3|nr:hypothetical protein [Lamprobacter modestohalophilus]MEA1053093.1 hypothetical protein [Lamprobacter modestohalophilus]